MRLDQPTFDALAALALGFAFAGLIASAVEVLIRRPVGLALLRTGDLLALASVPVLVFAGPLLIVRAILSCPRARRPGFLATVVATAGAGLWSLASGRLVLDLAHLAAGA